MKATVIVDNIPSQMAEGEWGLSICIDYNGKTILLDTGGSELFALNSRLLKLNLQDVDYAVLSHAHYDHSGGFERFFRENDKASLFLQKSDPCYFKFLFLHKYIGIPEKVLDRKDRIKALSGDFVLTEGVHLVAHHTKNLDAIGKRERMYLRGANGWRPDDFSHEQSLVFETQKGLVTFNSCSHGGVGNIIREVKAALPGKTVYGYVGGFHLFNKSESEIKETASAIRQEGLEYVATGHCTKDKAYRILEEELGSIMHQMRVGMVMEF